MSYEDDPLREFIDETIDVNAGKVYTETSPKSIDINGINGQSVNFYRDSGQVFMTVFTKIEHFGEVLEICTMFDLDDGATTAITRILNPEGTDHE